jgi:hypothetical protein
MVEPRPDGEHQRVMRLEMAFTRRNRDTEVGLVVVGSNEASSGLRLCALFCGSVALVAFRDDERRQPGLATDHPTLVRGREERHEEMRDRPPRGGSAQANSGVRSTVDTRRVVPVIPTSGSA